MARAIYTGPDGKRFSIEADRADIPAMIQGIYARHYAGQEPDPFGGVGAPHRPVTGTQAAGDVPPNMPAEIATWIRDNPDVVAEMLLRGGLSTAGAIGGGALAGPAGAFAGGGLGNMAGGMMTRQATDQPVVPTPIEGFLDVATGGAGPAMSAIGKGAARLATGVNRTVRREAREAGAAAAAAVPQTSPFGPAVAAAARGTAENAAVRDALSKSGREAGRILDVSGPAGALVQFISTGDITSAVGWLAGGAIASYGRRQAAETLLSSGRVRQWLLREGARASGTSISTTLGALALQEWMTGDQRAAARRLAGITPATERDGPTRNPFSIIMTPRGPRGQDDITGQFIRLPDQGD